MACRTAVLRRRTRQRACHHDVIAPARRSCFTMPPFPSGASSSPRAVCFLRSFATVFRYRRADIRRVAFFFATERRARRAMSRSVAPRPAHNATPDYSAHIPGKSTLQVGRSCAAARENCYEDRLAMQPAAITQYVISLPAVRRPRGCLTPRCLQGTRSPPRAFSGGASERYFL